MGKMRYQPDSCPSSFKPTLYDLEPESQDSFLEDWAADQPYGVFGALFYPERAVETTHRLQQFVQDVPTVLLPAHNADAPRRLAPRETVRPQREDTRRALRQTA